MLLAKRNILPILYHHSFPSHLTLQFQGTEREHILPVSRRQVGLIAHEFRHPRQGWGRVSSLTRRGKVCSGGNAEQVQSWDTPKDLGMEEQSKLCRVLPSTEDIRRCLTQDTFLLFKPPFYCFICKGTLEDISCLDRAAFPSKGCQFLSPWINWNNHPSASISSERLSPISDLPVNSPEDFCLILSSSKEFFAIFPWEFATKHDLGSAGEERSLLHHENNLIDSLKC